MRRWVLGLSVFVLTLTACSPDDAADTSTTLVDTTSTTAAVATTTTSTIAATTTTLPPPTTTTSMATTTTEPLPDSVEMGDEGISVAGEWFHFGYEDDDELVAAVNAVLGPPTFDSGWDFAGICPPPNLRSVGWGSGGDVAFRLLFTDADTDFFVGGVRHFFTFQYSATSEPTDLMTTEGIGVGSTLGDLKAAYDPAKITIEESPFNLNEGFWTYDIAPWTGLWGFSTGQGDADTIISINGGRGCGE